MGDILKWIPICLGLWCIVSIVLGFTVGPSLGRYLGEIAKQYPEVKNEDDNQM